MSAALGSLGMHERYEPGAVRSAVLSAAVHLFLRAALVFGVRWQNRPPEAVVVELWESPPTVMSQPEPPALLPEPQPQQAVPPPPPPPPEAAARIEKPDIARKTPLEVKPKPAPPKPAVETKKTPEKKKTVEKRAPPKPDPAVAAAQAKRMNEELAREQAALRAQGEIARVRELAARGEAAARAKALADYESKIRAKVRGNLVLPHDIEGNPEAIFDVVQLPTGEVITARLRKSSGHRGYDEALERAILKSSPLPRPDRPDIFSRELRLTFHPQER